MRRLGDQYAPNAVCSAPYKAVEPFSCVVGCRRQGCFAQDKRARSQIFARPKSEDRWFGARVLRFLVTTGCDDADTEKGLQACLDARINSLCAMSRRASSELKTHAHRRWVAPKSEQPWMVISREGCWRRRLAVPGKIAYSGCRQCCRSGGSVRRHLDRVLLVALRP